MNRNRFFRSDISTIALILANIVTIIFAVVQKWEVADVLWLYLAQSLIIVCFTSLRIMTLKQFSTEGLLDNNNQPIEPTQKEKWKLAIGVPLGTGLWNTGYVIFLYMVFGKPKLESTAVTGFVVCILIFLANHAFSYFYNMPRDRKRTPNVGKIFWSPFVRIIPMHLTLGLGGWFAKQESMSGSVVVLVFFLIIKTIVDVMMHNAEHSAGQEGEQTGL